MMLVPSREAPTLAKAPPHPGLYCHFKGGEYELLSVRATPRRKSCSPLQVCRGSRHDLGAAAGDVHRVG
jgi:hypothetical protein